MEHLLMKPKKFRKSKAGKIKGSKLWIFKTWR
jgi:hypothetical protein